MYYMHIPGYSFNDAVQLVRRRRITTSRRKDKIDGVKESR